MTIDESDISEIEKSKLKEGLFENKGEQFTKLSIETVGEVVAIEMDSRGDVYTHDKFFKEIQTNNLIKNHFLRKYGLTE